MLCSCSLVSRPGSVDLCILYTTDTHSMICPYDFHHNEPSSTSLANFSSLVKMQRAVYGDKCLVFDNGNKLNGSPTAYYYKFADTISEPLCYRAEREIRYDGVGIGAYDIEVPECLLPKRHDNARQPLTLCANLLSKQTGLPLHQPYAVFERSGVRIAVLGMLAPTSGDWLPTELWNQFETIDMIECAKQWIPIIKEQEKPDVIVGLFSCNDDYAPNIDINIDTYKNPSGGLPAAIRVPGFDLILLGNSDHSRIGNIRDDEGHSVPYIQCGENCEKAGLARIHLQKRKDDTYQVRVFSSLIDLAQYEPDPVFIEEFQNAQDSIFVCFNRQVGYLDTPLAGEEGLYGPDTYRDFINDAQLWFSKADISVASVIIPHDTIPAGPITLRQVFDMYPHSYQLQVLSMTGEEVRRFLEWGYTCQFETMTSSKDNMLLLQKDVVGHILYDQQGSPTLQTKPQNYISAGGINYTIDLSRPAGSRVAITSWSDGRPFDPRELYKVAVSSYQLRDGGQFITKGLNWDSEELALHAVPIRLNSLRKVLFDYFTYYDSISVRQQHNWSILPQAYWEEAKHRESGDLDPIW